MEGTSRQQGGNREGREDMECVDKNNEEEPVAGTSTPRKQTARDSQDKHNELCDSDNEFLGHDFDSGRSCDLDYDSTDSCGRLRLYSSLDEALDDAYSSLEEDEGALPGVSSLSRSLSHRAEELAHRAGELGRRAGQRARRIRRRAGAKAEEIAHLAGEKAEELAEKVEEIAHLAGEKAEELAERVEEIAHRAGEKADEFAQRAEVLAQIVIEAGWTAVHHHSLPKWMRDNDYLRSGHRPHLPSFRVCFQSIFRIHTETGNIWTHLLGFLAFLWITVYFLCKPSEEISTQEKCVFLAFFLGAMLCLGFSTLFHTVYCHSENVSRIFSKLDYVGIAMLTIGSAVPWVYYSFYCNSVMKIVYVSLMVVLGSVAITVSMLDFFAKPRYRALRAATFVCLGMAGVIPTLHLILAHGWTDAIRQGGLDWLTLQAALYIGGALIYALRVPECIWPGKFDIWFQSHQIFHVFVVAAALVHLHGITDMVQFRSTAHGACDVMEQMQASSCHSHPVLGQVRV